MLLFGHRFIASEKFYHIASVEAVEHTPPNSTVYLDFCEKDLDVMEDLRVNDVNFALGVKNITEAIYAERLDAKYIVLDENLAADVQKIAENYLFDAKILVRIEDEEQIEEFAVMGIDGVVFTEAIIKVNS